VARNKPLLLRIPDFLIAAGNWAFFSGRIAGIKRSKAAFESYEWVFYVGAD
jgi:hypothetical protein